MLSKIKKLKKEINYLRNNWFSRYGIINRKININLAKLRNDFDINIRTKKLDIKKLDPNNFSLVSSIKSELDSNGFSSFELSKIINEKKLFQYIEDQVNPFYAYNEIMWKKAIEEEIKKISKDKVDRTYNGKIWWIDLYKPGKFDNPISELSLNPVILNSIAQYMNAIPMLEYIRLIVNPPSFSKELNLHGNRMYHIDTTFKNMVKIFINPFNMTEQNGPTYFLPKRYTKTSLFRNFPEPISDFELEEFSKEYKKDLKSTSGPPGKAYMIDVAKSLHQGGRCILPRTLLAISYVSPLHYMKKKNLINSDHMYYFEKHKLENKVIKDFFGI